MVFLVIAYGLTCLFVDLQYAIKEEIVFFCIPPSAFRGAVLDLWIGSNILLCLSVTITYGVSYAIAQCKIHSGDLRIRLCESRILHGSRHRV